MVESEELVQGVGVPLDVLEVGDDRHHPAEEVLVPAAEVLKGLGLVLTDAGLLDGEVHGDVHHRGERPGGLGQLVVGVHGEVLDVGPLDGEVHRAEVVGHLREVLLQPAERAGDRADRDQAEGHRDQHQGAGDDLVLAEAVIEVGGCFGLTRLRLTQRRLDDLVGRGPFPGEGPADGGDRGDSGLLVPVLDRGDELLVDDAVELDRRLVGHPEQRLELGLVGGSAAVPLVHPGQVVLLADGEVGQQAVDPGGVGLAEQLLGVDQGPGLVLRQEGHVGDDGSRAGHLVIEPAVDLHLVDGREVPNAQPPEREQRDGERQQQPRADLQSRHVSHPWNAGRRQPRVSGSPIDQSDRGLESSGKAVRTSPAGLSTRSLAPQHVRCCCRMPEMIDAENLSPSLSSLGRVRRLAPWRWTRTGGR